MSEEKKNVVIGIVLCIGAVIIIFLWSQHGGTPLAVDTSGDTGSLPSLTATPPPLPTYTNYNVAPYNPGSPSILGPQSLGHQSLGPISSGGCDCGGSTQCGPIGANNNLSVGQFNALIGYGIEAGAA